MYYHVIVETNEKVGKAGKNRTYTELDATDLDEINRRIVFPAVAHDSIHFDGYFLKRESITRIAIKQSTEKSDDLVALAYSKLSPNVFVVIKAEDIVNNAAYTKDITQSVFATASQTSVSAPNAEAKPRSAKNGGKVNSDSPKGKVFIVHGHDDHAKIETARFVEKIKYQAIILHEQASGGRTIIEKIEEHANVAFALVLYTPCDLGHSINEPDNAKSRARQNVVFEHGYLIGRLGRGKVCALIKDDIEIPNDISGVIYIKIDAAGAWKVSVAREMRAAECEVDMNDLY